MKAFLEQSESELEYLEGQIYQVDCALLGGPDQQVEDWSIQDVKNLFDLYRERQPNQDKVGRKELLEFLKRIIFKISICCERIEHFVNGRIRARNATLGVFDATIKDTVADKDQNLFEFEEIPKNKDKVLESPQDLEEKDILRTYCIQQVIYKEIERLKDENIGKQILADKISIMLKRVSETDLRFEIPEKPSRMADSKGPKYDTYPCSMKFNTEYEKWERSANNFDPEEIF